MLLYNPPFHLEFRTVNFNNLRRMDESIHAVISRLHSLIQEVKALMTQSEAIRSEAAQLRKWTREVVTRSHTGYLDFSSYLKRMDGGDESKIAKAPLDDGDRGTNEI
jgi:hypothetical protein